MIWTEIARIMSQNKPFPFILCYQDVCYSHEKLSYTCSMLSNVHKFAGDLSLLYPGNLAPELLNVYGIIESINLICTHQFAAY